MSSRGKLRRRIQSRELPRGFQKLESRLLLAATTPDDFVVQSNSLSYDSGAILYRSALNQPTTDVNGQEIIDLRVDVDGDQAFPLTRDATNTYEFDQTQQRATVAQLIQVDPNMEYRLDASTHHLKHYRTFHLGYAAYDRDGLRISPVHVNKFAGSTDTVLLQPISPSDTSIVVADATGWSNQFGSTNESRALAWYGYQDAGGHVYSDYTYTHNVLGEVSAGAWPEGGIAFDANVGGYRINLSEPWAGSSVAAGTAIRNAIGNHALFEFPVDRYNGAEVDHVTRPWPLQETIEISATFGRESWDADRQNQTALPPGVDSIRLSPTWELLGAVVRPNGDETESSPAIQTFGGTTRHVAAGSLEFVQADVSVAIDPVRTYFLSTFASVHLAPGATAPLETHSIGYTAFDEDGLPIVPAHVQRYSTATDTVLAQALQPGDAHVVLDDASGWSNSDADPRTRALAWYGYVDARGNIYEDYSYTRNVATDPINGLWSPNAILGNTIRLNEPWAGPSLPAGAAVRNAVAVESLVSAILNDAPLTTAGQRLQATVSGYFADGTPQPGRFPPGTAAIRAAALLNTGTLATDDIIVLESFAIGQTAVVEVFTDPALHQYTIDLDVLSNDEIASSSDVELIGVSAQLGTVSVHDDSIRYETPAWFVGSDALSYAVSDIDSGDVWYETASITIRGSNVEQDPALVQSLSGNATNQPVARPPFGNDDLMWSNLSEYRVAAGETLVVDGIRQLDLFWNDSQYWFPRTEPATVALVSGTSNGTLELNPDGTFQYTPQSGFVGTDSFKYAIYDGLRTNTAIASILVEQDATAVVDRNLRALALAMHDHHSAYKQFPVRFDFPGDFFDPDGRPYLSWRVHLLPFLGYGELFEQFTLTEPWDSANNLPLAAQMPDVYGDGTANEANVTRIQTITGPASVYHPEYGAIGFVQDSQGIKFRDLLDQPNNTIMLIQTGADRAVPWTAPEDAAFDFDDPLNTLGTVGAPGIPFVLFDGETGLLPPDVHEDIFGHFASRAGSTDVITPRQYLRQLAHDTGSQAAIDEFDAGGLRQDQYMETIALGLQSFHSTYNYFPIHPGHPAFNQGNPFLSWRVLLLPFIGEGTLWEKFDSTQPWDSPTNLPLLDEMPDIFRSFGDPPDSNTTRIRKLAGPGAAWDVDSNGLALPSPKRVIVDGLGNTILLVESGPDTAIPWTQPDRSTFDPADPLASLGNVGEFFRAVLADGSRIKLPGDIDASVFSALVTRDAERHYSPTDPPISEVVDPDTLKAKYDQFHPPRIQQDRSDQLKEIGLAWHNFNSAYKALPVLQDPWFFDSDGKPHLSWRVHLLPFMGHTVLYKKFNLNEPWDSPNNLPLLQHMPDLYRSLGDPFDSTTTEFMTFVDNGAPFDSTGPGPRFRDFLDGLASTILLVDAGSDVAVPWTQPRDLVFNPDDPYAALGDVSEGFFVLMSDGGVEFEKPIDPARLAAMITSNGRENIPELHFETMNRRNVILQNGQIGAFDIRLARSGDRFDGFGTSVAPAEYPITVADPDLLSLHPASISINDDNWDVFQSITFQAIDDGVFDGPQTTTISVAGQTFEVTVIDAKLDAGFDFGDAPAPYPSTLAENGAWHVLNGPRLGSARDGESDGLPSAGADGDDNNSASDEDGVMFGVVGLGSSLAAVNIDLQNAAEARVDAWLDFDGNGIWDATDKILDSVQVFAGLQTLNFAIPAGAVAGETVARVRVSSAGGLDPTGLAYNGEVEDYVVTLHPDQAPAIENVVVNDNDPQRSFIRAVTVYFDSEVIAPQTAFSIKNVGSGQVVDSLVVNSSVDASGKTVSVITFDLDSAGLVVERENGEHVLSDGNYQLDVDALQITKIGGGPNMAGPFTFGDEEADRFFALFGDSDGDRDVDTDDLIAFGATFRLNSSDVGFDERYDFDGDGDVDTDDLVKFGESFRTSLPF